MAVKGVGKEEEIQGYIKAHTLLGCLLKDIYSKIQVVYGNTLWSFDTVRRRKKKFDTSLQSVEKAPK